MPRPRRVDGRGSIRADRASAFELAVRVAASLRGRRGAVGAPDTARGGEPNCVTGRRERRAGSARERAAARSARRGREARAVSFATGGARRRLRNETVATNRSIEQSIDADMTTRHAYAIANAFPSATKGDDSGNPAAAWCFCRTMDRGRRTR